ncbi:hypothetical protein ACFLQU_03870 [Verrucomicrobiota bacterium]
MRSILGPILDTKRLSVIQKWVLAVLYCSCLFFVTAHTLYGHAPASMVMTPKELWAMRIVMGGVTLVAFVGIVPLFSRAIVKEFETIAGPFVSRPQQVEEMWQCGGPKKVLAAALVFRAVFAAVCSIVVPVAAICFCIGASVALVATRVSPFLLQ